MSGLERIGGEVSKKKLAVVVHPDLLKEYNLELWTSVWLRTEEPVFMKLDDIPEAPTLDRAIYPFCDLTRPEIARKHSDLTITNFSLEGSNEPRATKKSE